MKKLIITILITLVMFGCSGPNQNDLAADASANKIADDAADRTVKK